MVMWRGALRNWDAEMNEIASWFETQATSQHKNVLAEAVAEAIDFESMDDCYWPMWVLRKDHAIIGIYNEITEIVYLR